MKDAEKEKAAEPVRLAPATMTDMFTAEGREITFEGCWSLEGVKSARKMAEAGFYRPPQEHLAKLKEADTVICAYCEVFIGNWETADMPLLEHVKWYPRCRFIKQFPGGTNVNNELICVLREHGRVVCDSHKDTP